MSGEQIVQPLLKESVPTVTFRPLGTKRITRSVSSHLKGSTANKDTKYTRLCDDRSEDDESERLPPKAASKKTCCFL